MGSVGHGRGGEGRTAYGEAGSTARRLLVARGSEEVDLRGEVGAGVLLGKHVHRSHLRVPGDSMTTNDDNRMLFMCVCLCTRVFLASPWMVG